MKAVEYGALLGLQESTATKKPLGVWGRIQSLHGICEQKPALTETGTVQTAINPTGKHHPTGL